MNADKIIKNFFKAQNQLLELFGIDIPESAGFSDCTDMFFDFDASLNELTFGESENNMDYTEEVRRLWEKDGYSLFLVYLCTGGMDYMLFKD